jgi:hypothetical protein
MFLPLVGTMRTACTAPYYSSIRNCREPRSYEQTRPPELDVCTVFSAKRNPAHQRVANTSFPNLSAIQHTACRPGSCVTRAIATSRERSKSPSSDHPPLLFCASAKAYQASAAKSPPVNGILLPGFPVVCWKDPKEPIHSHIAVEPDGLNYLFTSGKRKLI